jgi:UDP-N-acetylmuramate dehydrogenase
MGRAVAGGYKVPAAQLIEACGLRGRRFGRAGVAERHALVLVNHGSATGADLLAAATAVEAAVMDSFGVPLEREVQVIGGEERR